MDRLCPLRAAHFLRDSLVACRSPLRAEEEVLEVERTVVHVTGNRTRDSEQTRCCSTVGCNAMGLQSVPQVPGMN